MFRKNTAGQHFCFQGVDSSTGDIKSGVTWTVRRCIEDTFANATGSVTEDGTTGWYNFAMSQADTNGNNIAFNFTGSGAIPQTVNIVTTAADPTDGVRFGLTALPNAAADAAGGLPISDAGGLDLDAQLVTKINDILTDTGTTLQGELDGIQADTEDIQTRLPAALVSGRIDASVGAIAANAITAASMADDASAEIADAVWDEDATVHQLGGTFGLAIGDPGANTETIYDAVVTDAAGTNVAADIIAVKAETATIVADTNELQTDWANGGRLDLILDARSSQTSVDDLPTNAELATALGTADDAVLAAIAALNDLSAAQVNAEVVDALATDTYAEPGQGAPNATTTLAAKINYLYKSWRNKKDNDGTTTNLYADDAATVDQKQTTSESGGTVTKGEWTTGP